MGMPAAARQGIAGKAGHFLGQECLARSLHLQLV